MDNTGPSLRDANGVYHTLTLDDDGNLAVRNGTTGTVTTVGEGGGGGGGGLASATETTTADLPNSYDDTMTVYQAADAPVLAFGVPGDDYARIVIMSDSTDAIIYASDGTTDPLLGDLAFGVDFNDPTKWRFVGSVNLADNLDVAGALSVNGSITSGEISALGGVILHSPDETAYRLVVDDAGALSTVAV